MGIDHSIPVRNVLRDNTTGSAWATPAYDRAGNMIGIPHPGASVPSSTVAWNPMTEAQWNTFTEAQWNVFELEPTTHPEGILSARYDAWNRLVSIRNGNDLVMENVYDARGYRIRKHSYVSGELDEERHYYYTPGWQVVEERVGSASTADRQYVWGLRYIDDLVERQRDSNGNGTLDETRYGLQDANWNKQASTPTNEGGGSASAVGIRFTRIPLSEPGGTISERFAYTAYGEPEFMNGSGTVQTSSASNFETLYAGYRWDRNLTDLPPVYYVRNRFLLPQIGTWNRRDPLGYVDGMSFYEYAPSSPLAYVDPDGTRISGGPRPTAHRPMTTRPRVVPRRNRTGRPTGPVWEPPPPFPIMGPDFIWNLPNSPFIVPHPGLGPWPPKPEPAPVLQPTTELRAHPHWCEETQSIQVGPPTVLPWPRTDPAISPFYPASPLNPYPAIKPRRRWECRPCKPPVGSIAYRIDRAPSPPHRVSPTVVIDVPHSHRHQMHQSPPAAGCICFWRKLDKHPIPGEHFPEIVIAGGGGLP